MLSVVDQAFRSDTGRQRTANEDSLFVRSPVFAVADGMGGAKAGEVASRIAVESVEAAGASADAPEVYLRRIAEAANTRIHRHAQADSAHAGMGTTLTLALLHGEEVSFAHVGDSRAYVLRDGAFKMVTSDHSLVEELRRQGRLTEAQAEDHPQRSIITRALGPEPQVEIDTLTVSARPGDVFLLCSDGLTTMIKDEEIARILGEYADLEEAASRLIDTANDAGGRDNITVVAFRLAAADDMAADSGATLIGPSAEAAGLTGEAVRGAAERQRAASRTSTATAPRGGTAGRRLRRVAKVLAVLALLAGVGFAAWYGARQVYFLGTDEGGRLTLYRGLPYELPLDVALYSEVYSIPVQVSSLPAERRESAVDHDLRGRDDAISLLNDLEAAAEVPAAADPPASGGSAPTDSSGGAPANDGAAGQGKPAGAGDPNGAAGQGG